METHYCSECQEPIQTTQTKNGETWAWHGEPDIGRRVWRLDPDHDEDEFVSFVEADYHKQVDPVD